MPSRARAALRELSDAVVRAGSDVHVLRALAWDRSVHRRFLAGGARELPRPVYPPLEFDLAGKLHLLRGLRLRLRGKNPAEALLRGAVDQLAITCRMLAARGTRAFYRHSVELFGDALEGSRHASGAGGERRDARARNLAIARSWVSRRGHSPERASLPASECRDRIEAIVRPVLGDRCRVRLSRRIAAFAAAGTRSIAVRDGARFTPRQARALAHHEGLWHVLTALNGAAQPVLTVLGSGLGFFTESQEGGGIVSEFLTGNLTNDRFAELGERTLAIHRAAQGADYPTVFRSLAERHGEARACHLAERVFRGGLLTGGAPFTKDAVYQRGYCSVSSFLCAALARGDDALVLAFFAGKLGAGDAGAVRALIDEGLVSPPRFLPAWWTRRERLDAQVTHWLTLSQFEPGRL